MLVKRDGPAHVFGAQAVCDQAQMGWLETRVLADPPQLINENNFLYWQNFIAIITNEPLGIVQGGRRRRFGARRGI